MQKQTQTQTQTQKQKAVAAAELGVHTRAPMSGCGGGGGVCAGYKHSLVKTAWRQLAEHRDHLVSLRKASALQTEYRREAQKRAAAEARYAQARSEREQLEAQLKALQQGVEISFASAGGDRSPRGYGGGGGGGGSPLRSSPRRHQSSPMRASSPHRGARRRPRTEVCLICGKEFSAEK
jgi:hypothetical protein